MVTWFQVPVRRHILSLENHCRYVGTHLVQLLRTQFRSWCSIAPVLAMLQFAESGPANPALRQALRDIDGQGLPELHLLHFI